jgi:hypothetical protein
LTLPVRFSHLKKTKVEQDTYHAILEIKSPISEILEKARRKNVGGKRVERAEDASSQNGRVGRRRLSASPMCTSG